MNPSGEGEWTTDTLHAHLQSTIFDMDRRIEERFIGQEKAVLTALTASDKRFESVNEFRATLTDQTATFIPRSEYVAYNKALEDKVDAVLSRLDRLESAQAASRDTLQERRRGMSASVALIGTLVGMTVAVITVVFTIISRT